MPNRLIDFVAYWRSRGYTMTQAYKLWFYVQTQLASKGKVSITEGTLKWARQAST